MTNEETRRHVQRAVDLFFNSLPKENQDPFKESKIILDKLRKEVREEIEKKEEKVTFENFFQKTARCRECEIIAIQKNYDLIPHQCEGYCKQVPKIKEDVCFSCSGTGIYRYEEPKEERYDCYCGGDCEHVKEEPKSTLKEEMARIINLSGTSSITRADKIISLFKDTLLKEIRNKRRSVGYANYVYEEDLIEIIQNL